MMTMLIKVKSNYRYNDEDSVHEYLPSTKPKEDKN